MHDRHERMLIYLLWVPPALFTSGKYGRFVKIISDEFCSVSVWLRQIHFMWPSLHITWTSADDVRFTSREVNVRKTSENRREMIWCSSMGKLRAQFRQKAPTTTFQRNEVVSAKMTHTTITTDLWPWRNLVILEHRRFRISTSVLKRLNVLCTHAVVSW